MILNMVNFCFLVAGSNKIGIGNLMRSISLAKYIKKNSSKIDKICFVIEKDQNLLKDILLKNGLNEVFESFDLSMNLDVKEILLFLERRQINVVVTDLPNLNQDQMNLLKKKNIVISFDEFKKFNNWGDMVINYNAYAIDWQYSSDNSKFIQLLGPTYFVLREQLSQFKIKTLNERKIDLVLSFGGSDPTGLTKIVYNLVKSIIVQFNLTTVIILGPLSFKRSKLFLNHLIIQIFLEILEINILICFKYENTSKINFVYLIRTLLFELILFRYSFQDDIPTLVLLYQWKGNFFHINLPHYHLYIQI